MEDTLGAPHKTVSVLKAFVLILVLMEDTLGEKDHFNFSGNIHGLNPCSNGRYSRRHV